MGKGPRYRVAFRRRRANLTDYKARKAMILSGIPRLVVRFSLKHVYVQLVEATKLGDRILTSAYSKELEKFGWKASYKNTSAAYLTGLLLGTRARVTGVEDAILDIGLRRPSAGAKVFATLKGVTDAGLKVPYTDRILPSEERIKGEHIVSYAQHCFEEERQDYGGLFSTYLARDLKPEQLVDHFDRVRHNILNVVESDK